jgi:exosome complex component RRP46
MPAESARDGGKPTVIVDPSPRQVELCRSVHMLAFTSHNELLLVESEGDFSMDEWDRVYETAQSVCCTQSTQGIDMVLDDQQQQGPDLRQFVRSIAEAKVAADLHWK